MVPQSTDFRCERTRRKQYAPPRRGIKTTPKHDSFKCLKATNRYFYTIFSLYFILLPVADEPRLRNRHSPQLGRWTTPDTEALARQHGGYYFRRPARIFLERERERDRSSTDIRARTHTAQSVGTAAHARARNYFLARGAIFCGGVAFFPHYFI